MGLLTVPAAIARQSNAPDPILTNLLAWYRLNEASGNAIDAHTGGYTLTQTGTVGSTTGKVGNARTFNGVESNYLSSTNAIFTRGDTNFYMACWVWVNSGGFTVEPAIAGRYSFSTNDRSYMIQFGSGGNARFVCSSNGTSATVINSAGTFGSNTWIFVEAYHDAASDLLGIAVNGGSFATTAFSGGLFGGTAPFAIGRANVSGTPGIALDGRVDNLILKSAIPDSTERARLYNSGSGMDYPG